MTQPSNSGYGDSGLMDGRKENPVRWNLRGINKRGIF